VTEVESIKEERKNDIEDSTYILFLEAGKRAAKIVEGEG
jgi:hypothetical protein